MLPADFNTAYMAIGDEYVHGDALQQDYAKAMYWYHKGAAAGDGLGAIGIALLYAQGLGVPKDNAEIVLWLQSAVDHSDPTSAYDLGKAYEQGSVVTQDLAKARNCIARRLRTTMRMRCSRWAFCIATARA